MSDRITGVVLFALAVGYGIMARGYTSDFASEPLGPASFPTLLAVLLGATSIYLIVRPGPEADWPRGAALLHQIIAVAVLTGYAFALEPLGFLLSTAVVVAVIAVQLGTTWLRAGILGVGGSVALFVLFDWVLGLPLPTGTLYGG